MPRQPMGRLRFHICEMKVGKNEPRASKVTLAIHCETRPVLLPGIVAKEARPGWIVLEIPPLEQWEEALTWLTPQQRERIAESSFYELLQKEIPRRVLKHR